MIPKLKSGDIIQPGNKHYYGVVISVDRHVYKIFWTDWGHSSTYDYNVLKNAFFLTTSIFQDEI